MKFSYLIAALGLIGMTVIPAVIDGQRDFRWGQDVETIEFAKRLEMFPEQIGDWKQISILPLDESSVRLLEPIVAVNRVYLNPKSEQRAHVFVLFGPTGPTAAHTPDICFSSKQYRQLRERGKVKLSPDSKSTCFRSAFVSRDVRSSYLQTWYAWTADGTWEAPERPRFHFAKQRCLVKVQIATNYSNEEELENDPTMEKFIAAIEKKLHAVFRR